MICGAEAGCAAVAGQVPRNAERMRIRNTARRTHMLGNIALRENRGTGRNLFPLFVLEGKPQGKLDLPLAALVRAGDHAGVATFRRQVPRGNITVRPGVVL